jgi:ABC-type amino acid transport substrate-binding protein
MRSIGIAFAAMLSGLCATASLAADDSIKNIQDAGIFRVGMAPAPPYQSANPATGEYEGYNVDMAKGVADVLGVKLQIVDASWSTLVPGLLDHKYDAIMANIFATPERALVVTFTQPYFLYGLDVIVKADGPLKTMDDLTKPGVVFSGISGGVDATYPAQIYPQSKTNALVSDDPSAPILQVLNGQADAAMVDPSIYLLLRGKNPQVAKATKRLNTDETAIRRTALSWAVRPDDVRLLNFLNVFIQAKVSTGESDRLRAKWYHTLESQQ